MVCNPQEGTTFAFPGNIYSCDSSTLSNQAKRTTKTTCCQLNLLFYCNDRLLNKCILMLHPGTTLEIALTGTALPVLLHITPKSKINFGECRMGEHIDTLCVLKNKSRELPVSFLFRHVAHFTTSLPTGKLEPGKAHDIIIAFTPNQIGEWICSPSLISCSRARFTSYIAAWLHGLLRDNIFDSRIFFGMWWLTHTHIK